MTFDSIQCFQHPHHDHCLHCNTVALVWRKHMRLPFLSWLVLSPKLVLGPPAISNTMILACCSTGPLNAIFAVYWDFCDVLNSSLSISNCSSQVMFCEPWTKLSNPPPLTWQGQHQGMQFPRGCQTVRTGKGQKDSESEDATFACSRLALPGLLDRTFTLNNRGCLLKRFESKEVVWGRHLQQVLRQGALWSMCPPTLWTMWVNPGEMRLWCFDVLIFQCFWCFDTSMFWFSLIKTKVRGGPKARQTTTTLQPFIALRPTQSATIRWRPTTPPPPTTTRRPTTTKRPTRPPTIIRRPTRPPTTTRRPICEIVPPPAPDRAFCSRDQFACPDYHTCVPACRRWVAKYFNKIS